MTDLLHAARLLAPAWIAGLMLGVFFFGGLWWTVRKSLASRQPALWIFSSLLLRMSVTLAGFYWVARGNWKPLLACLLGFIMARLLVTWLTRMQDNPPSDAHADAVQEPSHAP